METKNLLTRTVIFNNCKSQDEKRAFDSLVGIFNPRLQFWRWPVMISSRKTKEKTILYGYKNIVLVSHSNERFFFFLKTFVVTIEGSKKKIIRSNKLIKDPVKLFTNKGLNTLAENISNGNLLNELKKTHEVFNTDFIGISFGEFDDPEPNFQRINSVSSFGFQIVLNPNLVGLDELNLGIE